MLELLLEALQHGDVVGCWQHDAREQIGSDVLEERDILRQEFSQVDVFDGSEQEFGLVLVDVLPLEVTSSSQDRLDSTHTKIIMVLLGKLF